MKLKVTKVIKTLEPKHGLRKSDNKPYVVYAFLVDCTLDGNPIEAVQVKTMSEDQSKLVVPGYEVEANTNKFDPDALDLVMPARPAPAAGGGGWKGGSGGGGKSKWIEPEKYTWPELTKLWAECNKEAHKVLCGVMGQDVVDASAVQSGAATLLIQATKSGIKL